MNDKTGDQLWWMQPLASLTSDQWEALCDGCGKCCLHKLQDEETDEIYFTAVACRFLDEDNIRCSCYSQRETKQPECLIISSENIEELAPWLPSTCAYRLRYEGQNLPSWHPLITGVKDSVAEAGHSVRHRIISETQVVQGLPGALIDQLSEDEWQELVIMDWC